MRIFTPNELSRPLQQQFISMLAARKEHCNETLNVK
jgi:hypothetical protein